MTKNAFGWQKWLALGQKISNWCNGAKFAIPPIPCWETNETTKDRCSWKFQILTQQFRFFCHFGATIFCQQCISTFHLEVSLLVGLALKKSVFKVPIIFRFFRAKEIFPLRFTKSMRPEPCWHKQLEERAQNWEKPFLPSGNPWLWINHHYWASYWAIDVSQYWAS